VGPDQTQHLSFCTGYYSHGRFDVSKVAAKLNYQLALVTFFYIRPGPRVRRANPIRARVRRYSHAPYSTLYRIQVVIIIY